MPYRDYLRLEGFCSIALGAEMALVTFPGLIVSWSPLWAALLFVPGVLVLIGAFAALRNGAELARPGDWLTERPLTTATEGRAGLDARHLTRRLLIETVFWMVGITSLVLFTGSSALIIFGTGLASAAFGALQAFASRARVLGEEQSRGRRYVVAERPGLGTPRLGVG